METRYPTKHPVQLFYRDPLTCLETLFENPLFKDHLKFTPFRLYKMAEQTVCVFTEWLSSDTAWLMQVRLFNLKCVCELSFNISAGRITPWRNTCRHNFVIGQDDYLRHDWASTGAPTPHQYRQP